MADHSVSSTAASSAPGNLSKTASYIGSSPLMLKVRVVKGRDLAPKDKSGFSDPYLVLVLGDSRQATSAQHRTLNPEWNQTIDLPITGFQSAVLDCICWDKDRFGKDYMGEIEVAIEDIFSNGKVMQEPRWYPLESKRPGKKTGIVTGDVQLQFSLSDPSNPSIQPNDLFKRLFALIGSGGSGSSDMGEEAESPESEPQEELNEVDGPSLGAAITVEEKKKRKYLKIANLKKKAQQKGYEFGNGSSVAGVLFIEIQKITDLPPERNVTRTGFDMDPFVVISLGRKTYRTRVMRHNLNPVFDEKLVFQVARHETSYSMSFTVVDRDNFSGNDYVGKVDLPLEKIINLAPEPDHNTGLFAIPDGMVTPNPEAKKSRFRLPLSRSASSQSLSKQARMPLSREPSSANLKVPAAPENPVAIPPTSMPPSSEPGRMLAEAGRSLSMDDESLKPFILSLNLKNKEKWPDKKSTLYIRAKYVPYHALRQQFWRAMLRQYDADDSGRIDKLEFTTMLDSLGSTLHESTIDGFFARYPQENSQSDLPSLSFDEAVICLEDQLSKSSKSRPGLTHTVSNLSILGEGDHSGATTPSRTQSMAGLTLSPDVPDMGDEPPALEPISTLDSHGLSDDRGEEHLIEIRECPICHQPRLNKRSDSDIVTHIATCASQDWRKVNNIVMGGFVTASQAQRKWYSKVVTKIGYGGYRLGANSANILVQDRITGQINEEKMSVYVRLGIRLLYKGLKSNNMEMKRTKRLLKSLSIKQGTKYDDPASAAQIRPFIDFHGLDMGEVLLPVEQFQNFNQFFYRALKPDARPCAAPNNPYIVTSPADCRSVVFNTLDEAQKIWVKGRNFTVERLLGQTYPDDAKKFIGGALGIFRLAPQDYHRFHVPVDGIMGEPKLIDGDYYTVNPMAIRSALDVYGENVRVIVPIDSEVHGRVIVVCVGAMMVGSTVITRKTGEHVKRAEELGYFKFGGSTILVLFEKGKIAWDDDMVSNSAGALETLIQVGMSVAHSADKEQFRDNYQKREEDITEADKADAQRRIVGGTGTGHPLI